MREGRGDSRGPLAFRVSGSDENLYVGPQPPVPARRAAAWRPCALGWAPA